MRLYEQLIDDAAAAARWSDGLLAVAVLLGLGAVLATLLVRNRRRRIPVVVLSAALFLASAATLVLRTSIEHDVGGGRMAVVRAMQGRPDDPWPRGSGHVPLGPVGAAPDVKGYLEPGGSFSPAVGSFGVSFWVVAPDGGVRTTGDTMPLQDTRHEYVPGAVPSIRTETPAYVATWSAPGPGRATLDLVTVRGGDHVEIVLRSVGPAGGPLRSIERTGATTLQLGDRWQVRSDEELDVAFLGSERPGWTRSGSAEALAAHDPDGWAAARLRVAPGAQMKLELQDGERGEVDPESWPAAAYPLLPGADARFDASLRAQIETLRQSIFGEELAPGDPTNYPLAWLRDGAYSLVALARSGDTARLRELAMPFAERDFFGGFGAEADAPGLALWALDEASIALGDPRFDLEIWPHVLRKVEIIERLRAAQEPIRMDFSGPVVPEHRTSDELTLVAEPSRNGLIDGRVDWRRPVFFVNAVSYLGLHAASRIAERSGHRQEAAAWLPLADEVRAAWRAAFARSAMESERMDDRTAISALWPSEVAEPDSFAALMRQRWDVAREAGDGSFREHPLWTYFDVAEAHQWLRLGDAQRVWSTIDWFWRHQPAPGLYTLWEGEGEENSFGLWKQTRGWVRPESVTPHYWAAAEMLLLQLAMLAEVQGPPGDAVLVIGGGVPAAWLRDCFAVGPIGTSVGRVGWSWDGRSVHVTSSVEIPVRLGSGFPTDAPVRFEVSRDAGTPTFSSCSSG